MALRLTLLNDLLSLPMAPFREALIQTHIRNVLAKARVPHFTDATGNIVVGAKDARDYLIKLRASRRDYPLKIFIAHMDHPGFHGEKWLGPRRLRGRWFGGSPTRGLVGAKVWVNDGAGFACEARVAKARLRKGGHAIETLEVQFKDGAARMRAPEKLFGGFGFRKPIWRRGDVFYTKAADDLIGVLTILNLALDTRARKNPNFIGLITRAEEVGFIGAIGHFEEFLKDRDFEVLAVSLEASRTLPGALVGRGPIVRLGDRTGVFDAASIRVFSDLAEKVLPKQYQRRIMDGGSCEASVAVAYDYPAIGISVPLGNYHNQNFEGGPDSHRLRHGPAPEFVHLRDIEGQLRLCHALVAAGTAWSTPWKARRAGFQKSFRGARKLLR